MAGEAKFKPGQAKEIDLSVAAADRLADAEILLANGRHASAIAMGLYALEIQLKALICRRLDLDNLLSAFEIHDFDALLRLSGLSRRIEGSDFARVKSNWDFITTTYNTKHINELRYLPDARWSANEATELLTRLRDDPGGILPWLLAPA